jgi:hypothetical protein
MAINALLSLSLGVAMAVLCLKYGNTHAVLSTRLHNLDKI